MSEQEQKKTRLPLFRREERHELRYQLSVLSASAFSWFAWMLPSPLRMIITDISGLMFYKLSNTYRENVASNVRQVLGEDASDERVVQVSRSIFRTSARNFLDVLLMARTSKARVLKRLESRESDWKLIEAALARGNGVLLVTGHIGSFDFLAQAFLAKGYPLTIVTGRTTSRFIFDGVTSLRSSHGNILVEPTPSGVRHSYRALRRNELTVIVSDRDFFQNGKAVQFFGKKTTLPPGAVRMARDTGATVVPVLSRRLSRGRHAMSLLTPFTIEKTNDVERDIAEGVQRIADVLEECIRDNVDQWAMFQRVWPDQAPDPVRVFPVGSPLESPLLERVASALPERKTTPGAAAPGVLTRLRKRLPGR